MNIFFSKYRNKLENQKFPDFNEQDWQQLEKKLDDLKRPKNGKSILLWPLLLAIPILSAWSYYNWTNLNKNKKAYSMSNHQQLIPENSNTINHDTIYINKYITIYKDKLIYSSKVDHTSSINASETNQENETRIINAASVFEELKNNIDPSNISPVSILKDIVDDSIKLQNSLKSSNTAAQLEDTSFVLPNVDPQISLPLLAEKTSWIKKLKKTVSPIQLYAGPDLGYLIISQRNATNKLGYFYGLNGSILWASNFKLGIGVSYENLYYESSRIGGDSGIPVVSPPSNDFVFELAEINRNSYNVSTSLVYRFRSHKALKPTLGLGISWKHSEPFQVVYEFQHPALQIDWLFENSFNSKYKNSFYWNLSTGIDMEWASRYQCFFNVLFLKSFNKGRYELPDYIKLQLGFHYRLY